MVFFLKQDGDQGVKSHIKGFVGGRTQNVFQL